MLIDFCNLSAGRNSKECSEIGMECLKRKTERKNLTHTKEVGSGSLTALKNGLHYNSIHFATLKKKKKEKPLVQAQSPSSEALFH